MNTYMYVHEVLETIFKHKQKIACLSQARISFLKQYLI